MTAGLTTQIGVFHKSVSVFIPLWGRIPSQRCPVRRDRPVSIFIVAREPVPRAHSITRAMARDTRSDARVASEGPSPTMKEGRFSTVARGPVPRDHWDTRTILPICSSGAPAPETGQEQGILTYRRGGGWCLNAGEGQALALR